MRTINADALKIALDTFATIVGFRGMYDRGQVMECIDAATTIGGWISVKDRLPNHNNRVPVLYRFTDEDLKSDELFTSMLWYVREPFCNNEAPHWERLGKYEYEVLYWYELPEPPKEGKENA